MHSNATLVMVGLYSLCASKATWGYFRLCVGIIPHTGSCIPCGSPTEGGLPKNEDKNLMNKAWGKKIVSLCTRFNSMFLSECIWQYLQEPFWGMGIRLLFASILLGAVPACEIGSC